MPRLKNVLTLFAFLCLSFNSLAQTTQPLGVAPAKEYKPGIFYALLLQGMPSPYDTAIAVNIIEYRRIRTKLLLADELVAGKDRELAQAYEIIQEKDSAQNVTLEIARANARANERLTATNAQLNRDYDELYLRATAPKPLIQRPWFLITVGAVGGAILKSL